MLPEIAERFQKLEERREALVQLVRSMPTEKQSAPPDPNSFSPAETISHMALAEEHDLVQMRRRPPSSFAGKKARPSFMYRFALRALQNVKRSPTLKEMLPTPGARLEDGVAQWGKVRAELKSFFEQASEPNKAFCKLFPFGTLSASDLFDLLEAHMHYHETLLSRI